MSIFTTSLGEHVTLWVGVRVMVSKFLLLMVTVMGGFFLVSTSGSYAVSSTYVLDPKLPDESAWACGSLGGSWSNINSTCMLRNYFTLDSGGLIKVESGASLDMLGRINMNAGSRTANYGTIILQSNSEIKNEGIIDNFEGGAINSTSDVSNVEWVSINNKGIMTNHDDGTILNYGRGIYNYRIFVNKGTIVNSGEISNVEERRFETYGIITNKGDITNLGEFDIYSTVDNQNGSRIYTYESGIITIHGGGRIISGGAIFNRGRIEINGGLSNKGVIDNYGLIFNNGNTVNNSNGTIINHNIGSIDNKVGVDNYGNITTIFGVFSNTGNIKNYGGIIDGIIFGNSAANICISTTTTTTTSIITATTSIERIAEPTIYSWAVGVTVTTIVLAVILILRKRR